MFFLTSKNAYHKPKRAKASIVLAGSERGFKRGFTLLETLVAVFILTLALTGPIYIATLAIRTSVASRDGISARYLAEEVIERMRNERDYRSLRGAEFSTANWLQNITGGVDCSNPPGDSGNVCELQIDSSSGAYLVVPCAGIDGCAPLHFTPNSPLGFYGLNDGTALTSKFSREFYFQTAAYDGNLTETPKREVKLIVNIRWNDHGHDKVYSIEENLHNIAYSTHAQ